MSQLYPLKFKPQYFSKIWGGKKIRDVLGFKSPAGEPTGEAWLLSGVEEKESVVENGFLSGNNINELVEVYMSDLVGDHSYEKYGNEFPVLLKILDTNDWLSVQVHPGDDLAMKRYGTYGKSEMWYIMEAEKDARLVGHIRGIPNREQLKRHVNEGKVREILQYEPVEKGDSFFIPAGRVHALGPGIMLAEIQQTSDITYRIYDWDRIDAAGFRRELHTEEALDAVDYKIKTEARTNTETEKNETAGIVTCPHFTVNMLDLDKPLRKDFSELDSFVIYLCAEGAAKISTPSGEASLRRGELVLIPAINDAVDLFPDRNSALLEVYILPSP